MGHVDLCRQVQGDRLRHIPGSAGQIVMRSFSCEIEGQLARDNRPTEVAAKLVTLVFGLRDAPQNFVLGRSYVGKCGRTVHFAGGVQGHRLRCYHSLRAEIVS